MTSGPVGVWCSGLREKSLSLPDPYIKLRVLSGRDQPRLAHHTQLLVSAVQYNTVDPHWEQEVGVAKGHVTIV